MNFRVPTTNENMIGGNYSFAPIANANGTAFYSANGIHNNYGNLIHALKNAHYKYMEFETIELFYAFDELYFFPKIGKVKNLTYIYNILVNHLTIYPLNLIHLGFGWYIKGIQIFESQPTDNEILVFCEQIRLKNIFLNLNRSNFVHSSIGVFIKNPECFLPRLNILGTFLMPKCPCFHEVTEDFNNGLYSEDKLYWCPICSKHYHKSQIKFEHITNILEEIK